MEGDKDMSNTKDIKDMTIGEMLRQQLELLAERSLKTENNSELVALTGAMVELFKA